MVRRTPLADAVRRSGLSSDVVARRDLICYRHSVMIHDPAGKEKHARGELRVDPRRDSILARVGLRPGMCYDEICAKVGGPSAEKLLLVQ